MRYKNNERGFTLIEIMVVVVILGILASYVAVRYVGKTEEAQRTQARVQIESFSTALAFYKMDNGTYPSTEQGLQSLVEPPTAGQLPRKWKEGGYLQKKQVPKDPWEHDYVYISPGLHDEYDLSSYGNDGVQGGEGEDKDVNSWEAEE